ncbi:hypothetical protein WJX77_011251 [Trebouxia sp. C0004]
MNCPRVRQDALPGDHVSQVAHHTGAEVQAQWGLSRGPVVPRDMHPLLASDSHDHHPANRPHVSALSLTSWGCCKKVA